jgi:putative transposase
VARIPRRLLVELGSTNHCTWRSHNSTHVFELDTAKQIFLDLIRSTPAATAFKVRSYCLMGTHPHLVVVATKGQAAFSRFWQIINHLFARWYNRQQKSRRGQVVTQRMKSPMIQPGANGRHVLTVMRYGDLNPVRAGMVPSPKDYAWSSYRHYAYGDPNDLIEDEPEYLALGRTSRERREAYKHLFATPLASALRTRRPDIVEASFYGDPGWVERHAPRAAGPPPLALS